MQVLSLVVLVRFHKKIISNIITNTQKLLILVGLALIGGILAWINRRGGCTKRDNGKNGFSQDDYTIDMNQNDFNHGPGAGTAAAVGLGAGLGAGAAMGATQTMHSTEPLSPFDNQRRYAPTPVMGNAEPVYNGQEYYQYNDGQGYSEGYSQDGYQQGVDYNNYAAGAGAADYGYYDANHQQAAAYGQQPQYMDSARHEYYDPNQQQQKHYSDVTSPTMSAGNLSEGYAPSSDKPNLKDYHSKPNEM